MNLETMAPQPEAVSNNISIFFFSFFKIYLFIFIQLQLSAFSPHPSTPPQPVPPPSPTSTVPLYFVLVSFIVAPIDPSLDNGPTACIRSTEGSGYSKERLANGKKLQCQRITKANVDSLFK